MALPVAMAANVASMASRTWCCTARPHAVLLLLLLAMVDWLRRVGHGRLKQRLVVAPGFDKLFVELRKVVWR